MPARNLSGHIRGWGSIPSFPSKHKDAMSGLGAATWRNDAGAMLVRLLRLLGLSRCWL